jgi:hypothetical protein
MQVTQSACPDPTAGIWRLAFHLLAGLGHPEVAGETKKLAGLATNMPPLGDGHTAQAFLAGKGPDAKVKFSLTSAIALNNLLKLVLSIISAPCISWDYLHKWLKGTSTRFFLQLYRSNEIYDDLACISKLFCCFDNLLSQNKTYCRAGLVRCRN